MSVVIETTIGTFTVDLFTNVRPKLCENFLKLCKVKYYNGCLFHNIQSHFIAQSGDPGGTGRGGESIYSKIYGDQAKYFEPLNMVPKIKHIDSGMLSMVSGGEYLFGSQFIITLDENLDSLDAMNHAPFGMITENLDVILEKFNSVVSDDLFRPYKDVRITHTVILYDPFPDLKGLSKESSPEPDWDGMANSERLGFDEMESTEENDFENNEMISKERLAELEEIRAEKESKSRATVLEIIGDLPEADVAPPENVLFVCKLNPVTSDEDLELIFSRFGRIVSCEIIKDHETKQSLQYAFIEYEDAECCNKAYFKMDNVLIDDRRIHVDFSQSVSRVQYSKFKRSGLKKSEHEHEDKKDSTFLKRKSASSRKDSQISRSKYSDSEDEIDSKHRHKERFRSSPSMKNHRRNDRERSSRSPRRHRIEDYKYKHRNDYERSSRHKHSRRDEEGRSHGSGRRKR